MRRAIDRQRGFGLLLAVFALVLMSAMFIGGIGVLIQLPHAAALERQKTAYLGDVAGALSRLYTEHLDRIDAATEAPWSGTDMLGMAGIGPRWNLQIAVSSRQIDPSGVGYRNLYLWLPTAQPDPVTFDAAADRFVAPADTLWRKVDGREIEQTAMRMAARRLTRVADQLSAMFAAKRALDPAQDNAINHFQAAPCTSSVPGQGLPCTNGQYVALAALGATSAAGIAATDLTDPWGGQIVASNTLDADVTEPPYSLVLRATTPWGGSVTYRVSEPI